jgi:hypothetical protein
LCTPLVGGGCGLPRTLQPAPPAHPHPTTRTGPAIGFLWGMAVGIMTNIALAPVIVRGWRCAGWDDCIGGAGCRGTLIVGLPVVVTGRVVRALIVVVRWIVPIGIAQVVGWGWLSGLLPTQRGE